MPPVYLFGFGLTLYLIYKGYRQGRSERKRKANLSSPAQPGGGLDFPALANLRHRPVIAHGAPTSRQARALADLADDIVSL